MYTSLRNSQYHANIVEVIFVEQLEKAMRQEFSIGEEKEVKLWNRYMTNMYEPLNKRERTLQDSGLYHGQVVVIEQKNDDGTWPRQNQNKRWVVKFDSEHTKQT